MKKQQSNTDSKQLTAEEVDVFEKALSQLKALHSEIAELSKKAQNDGLNKFKLKFTNHVLAEANKLLGDKYKPFPDFDLFDDNDVPTNSDATFIISQYLGCMEKLRVDNIDHDEHYEGHKRVVSWYWKDTERPTYPPLSMKDK